MDYFSILNLNKEPFSNSPDPEYFFHSHQHVGCLQKLELSLRLRRGLNVVIGDVGTGKTTLCRQLIRKFRTDAAIETHLILDPYFSTPHEFLLTVTEMLAQEKQDPDADDYQLKERIKKLLFQKGVDEQKTTVLIIDEGQKIPVFCLGLLREFLNYETNDYKLLQIAIFAQTEFESTLEQHENFTDRINLYHRLEPMSFKDTRDMIQFRLNQSSAAAQKLALFTYPALWAIYRATRGYPRKIVNLCHRSILAMIIQNKTKANWFLVRSCMKRAFESPSGRSWVTVGLLAVCVVGAMVLVPRLMPEKMLVPTSPAPGKTQSYGIADTSGGEASTPPPAPAAVEETGPVTGQARAARSDVTPVQPHVAPPPAAAPATPAKAQAPDETAGVPQPEKSLEAAVAHQRPKVARQHAQQALRPRRLLARADLGALDDDRDRRPGRGRREGPREEGGGALLRHVPRERLRRELRRPHGRSQARSGVYVDVECVLVFGA